jgi:hypothetical protein
MNLRHNQLDLNTVMLERIPGLTNMLHVSRTIKYETSRINIKRGRMSLNIFPTLKTRTFTCSPVAKKKKKRQVRRKTDVNRIEIKAMRCLPQRRPSKIKLLLYRSLCWIFNFCCPLLLLSGTDIRISISFLCSHPPSPTHCSH